jgi:hypothetical protein
LRLDSGLRRNDIAVWGSGLNISVSYFKKSGKAGGRPPASSYVCFWLLAENGLSHGDIGQLDAGEMLAVDREGGKLDRQEPKAFGIRHDNALRFARNFYNDRLEPFGPLET